MTKANLLLELLYQTTGIQIECPIGNAAGIFKYPDAECDNILSLNACPQLIIGGTFTPPVREGNSGNTHYLAKSDAHPSNGDLNKLGFPNPGEAGARHFIERTSEKAAANSKVVGLNISGASEHSIDEIVTMFRMCMDLRVKYIQVNTSCSNLMLGNKKQKPVICYNLKLSEELFEKLQAVVTEYQTQFTNFIVDIKCAYFPDLVYHEEFASLLSAYPFINVVSAINTIGNTRRYDDAGAPIISTDGYAGLSGPAIFPIAIGQVARWRELLPEDKHVIGIGGIVSGHDMREMMYAGASMVQVASAYFRANNDVVEFNRIYGEYLELTT